MKLVRKSTKAGWDGSSEKKALQTKDFFSNI